MSKYRLTVIIIILANLAFMALEASNAASKVERSVIDLPTHDEQPVRSYGVNPGDGVVK